MRYVAFVGTEGRNEPEIVEQMNRDWPAYEAELQARLPWRAGRELDLPEQGAKVLTVRGGETVISDGPFAATKEYIAGLDIFECSSREEAIELEGKSPVARFLPFELRELSEGFVLGPGLSAFADCDDTTGVAFLLVAWTDRTDGGRSRLEPDELHSYATWRGDLTGRGVLVLGGEISPAETAVTLRPVDRVAQPTQGSFVAAGADVAVIDVIRARDWNEALATAATHPLARRRAIELRSFYGAEA